MPKSLRTKKFTKEESSINYRDLSSIISRTKGKRGGYNLRPENLLLDINKIRQEKGLEAIYPKGAASLIGNKEQTSGEENLRVFSANEIRVLENIGLPNKKGSVGLPDEIEKLRIRSRVNEPDFKIIRASLAEKGIDLGRLFAKKR